MEYSDAAIGYFALMALATLAVIRNIPVRSSVMLPIAGFMAASGVWLALAPKVGVVQLVGLMTLSWIVAASMTLAATWAFSSLRRRRVVYRRPGGLP